MSIEPRIKEAQRRGALYVGATTHAISWEEYMRIHNIPKVGNSIKVYNPDDRKVHDAIVTRIASNGIRATMIGMNEEDGLISVKVEISGVWAREEYRPMIERIMRGK